MVVHDLGFAEEPRDEELKNQICPKYTRHAFSPLPVVHLLHPSLFLDIQLGVLRWEVLGPVVPLLELLDSVQFENHPE